MRVKRLLVALLLAAVGLEGLWLAVSEAGPDQDPWADPLPDIAIEDGYARFWLSQGGRAIPGLAESWMERHPPDPDGPVLIDRFHSDKQVETLDLTLETYSYGRMHTYKRAFDPLREQGIELRQVRQRWRPWTLSGASAVFINLVSGDRPGFRWSETLALDAFVRAGGAVVLIVDHSNAYFHAEMLWPLLQRWGLDLGPYTAADRGPGRTMSPGSVAWLRMQPVGTHPIVQDVRAFGQLTGAVVRPTQPHWTVLSATSEQGWADLWDSSEDGDSSGFTGELKRQDSEEGGPLPTSAAAEIGAGRVVVLGDQNAFGSTVIGYEDTERYWVNAWAWALRRPIPLDLRGEDSVTVTAGPTTLCGSVERYAFRTLQVMVHRLTTHHGQRGYCTSGGEVRSKALVVLPGTDNPELARWLDGAQRVVAPVIPGKPGADAVLAWLGRSATPVEQAADGLRWLRPMPHVEHPVFKAVPEVEPIGVTPVVLSGEGIEVLAEDTLGRPVIVRVEHGGRQVVLVLDDRLLRNDALGKEREDPATVGPERLASHRVAWTVLETLFEAR